MVVVAGAVGLSAFALARPAEAGSPAFSAAGVVAHGGRGFCGAAGREAAAEALGMTVEALDDQLWAGESLADLADEAGVDLADIQDAVEAACQQATRDAIEQAVTDGTLTREHADWLLDGLDKGFWGANGQGLGGFGGRHGAFGRGPGFFDGPSFKHNAAPTPGSDS